MLKRFSGVTALAGIDLRVDRGETVALLGPNGAGKSTSINLLLGLLRPDGGTVSVLGGAPQPAMRGGRVGAMLQSGRGMGFPPGVSVTELISLAARFYPAPAPVEVTLARAGLAELANRRTERLSGGEAQRLSFALAVVGDPELVFLDEPTVAMDVESRRRFWTMMRGFAAEGRTVLFATHYLDEADAVADRIVVLSRGSVVADGTPSQIKGRVGVRRVRFTLPDLSADLSGLPGVTDVQRRGAQVSLRCVDADAVVRAICAQQLAFHGLEVTGADLEDAFVELTTGGESR